MPPTDDLIADVPGDAIESNELEAYMAQDQETFEDFSALEGDDDPGEAQEASAEETAEEASPEEPEQVHAETEAKDDTPPWVQKLMAASDARVQALEESNKRLADMFERSLAGTQEAELPKPRTPDDMMREALDLADDDPDKKLMLRAAAMAQLGDEWTDDESKGRAANAAKFLKRGLADRRHRAKEREAATGDHELLQEWKRERETTRHWDRLASSLPAFAETDDAKSGFAHSRLLFADPSVLRPFVAARIASSDKPVDEAMKQALGDLEEVLADSIGDEPAELRATARYLRRRDPELASVLDAYAKMSAPESETVEKPAVKTRRKVQPPRAPTGGATRSHDPNDLEAWMASDPDDWLNGAMDKMPRGKA